MVDVRKLKSRIFEAGLTVPELANRMEMNPSTLYRKLKNNGEGLLVKDVDRIISIIDLPGGDINNIFFAKNVA